MLIKNWDKLPENFKKEIIKPYWEKLRKKNFSLFWKRFFDILFSFIFLVILLPLFLIIALAIKIDSKGPVFYRQIRITQYGKEFKIHKFRSMVVNADTGNSVTTKNDTRITKVGKFIRKFKIDELSQLIDVFEGNMTLVGTRPEVPKYVEQYSDDYLATLLLPAGVTSLASVKFKDENDMLSNAINVDEEYVSKILPIKMSFNLSELNHVSVFHDTKIVFMTGLALLGVKFK